MPSTPYTLWGVTERVIKYFDHSEKMSNKKALTKTEMYLEKDLGFKRYALITKTPILTILTTKETVVLF